ncbi:MAG: sulfatase [Cyclobacteriaceae bacterium]|nr:sulfatase [Cyclobacteriaceae bacterium]
MKILLNFPFIALFLFTTCTSELQRPKPNIVFILADDFGYQDMSYRGSQFYETPNLDKLASESVVFDAGYANCQVCSPSRASIMTGKFPARHGITDWIGAPSGEKWRDLNRHNKLLPAEYNHQLDMKEITMAEALKEAGYKTFFAGKWHLGNEGSYPEDHGFDVNVGGWEKGSPMGGYFSPYNNPKIKDGPSGENLTSRLARETLNFIQLNKDSTFFAFLSFYAVHGPIETTKEKWSKYRLKALENGVKEEGYVMEHFLPIRQVQDNPVYAGLVETMDEAIGLVMDGLKELGLENNTIVVFTSDNGGVSSGDAFSTSNLPFRGGKGYQWEGGIREPYFIKVPWLNTAGKNTGIVATGTDFYPTLLDLAGLPGKPEQHLDGVSLLPIIQGNSIPDRPVYWHYPHYGNQGGQPSSIIRMGDWKLIHYWEDGHDELYNLAEDPFEAVNLSDQIPEKSIQLSNQLLGWLQKVNAKIPEPDTLYTEYLARNRYENMVEQKLPQLEAQRLNFLSEDFQPNEDWWGSLSTTD